jgi:putative holliday junction resolvase
VRLGVRIGIDVGKVRVGVSRSTPEASLAIPVATLDRSEAIALIADLAGEWDALELVVGLPVSLQGRHTASTEDAESFARELSAVGQWQVRMVDERLSTVSATAQLHASKKRGKEHRGVVDQVAAVILLQHALDYERLQGVPPGILINPL